MSVVEAQSSLAEVCFLLAEYRQRILTYKYADFSEKDAKRRVDRFIENKRREKEKENADDLGELGEDGALANVQQELDA